MSDQQFQEQALQAIDELIADGTFVIGPDGLDVADEAKIRSDLDNRREERKAAQLDGDDSSDQERLILGFAVHGQKDNTGVWAKFRQALGLRPDQRIPSNIWSETSHSRLSDEVDAIFRGERDVRTLNGRTLVDSYRLRIERGQATGSVQGLSQMIAELSDEVGGFVENDMKIAIELLQSARAREALKVAGRELEYALRRDRNVETVFSDLNEAIENAKKLVKGRLGEDIEFDTFESLAETLKAGMLSPKAQPISTSIPALDMDLQGGVNPMDTGKLNVIAARTGVGKTTVGIAAAMGLTLNGGHTLFLSCELSQAEIGARAMANYAHSRDKLDCKSWILEGRGTTREVPKNYDAVCDLWTLERQAGEIGNFQSKAIFHAAAEDMVDAMYAAKAKDPQLSAVFIDHFHALRPSKGFNNRSQEMEARILYLYQAAKACKVDLFLMAQLNREACLHDKPQLDHINGTDVIAQLATAVWLFEFPKRAEGEPFDGQRLVLHHGKFRNGQRDANGKVVSFDKHGLMLHREYCTCIGEFAA